MDHCLLHICMFLLKTKRWFVDIAKNKNNTVSVTVCCLIPRAETTPFLLSPVDQPELLFIGEHHQPFNKYKCFPIFLSIHQRWRDVQPHPPKVTKLGANSPFWVKKKSSTTWPGFTFVGLDSSSKGPKQIFSLVPLSLWTQTNFDLGLLSLGFTAPMLT